MKQIYLLLAFLCFGFINGQDQTVFKDDSFNAPKFTFLNMGKLSRSSYPNNNNNLIKIFERTHDGKFIVIGDFEMFNKKYIPTILRLNNDGSLDTTFIPNFESLPTSICGSCLLGNIKGILPLSNGKLLVFYGSTPSHFPFIIRLNNDGSIDNSFNFVNTTSSNLPNFVMKEQSNGSVIIVSTGGISINGTSYKIIRLLNDGLVDNNFIATNDIENNQTFINDLEILPDDRIILVGNLFLTGNTEANSVVILSSNGMVDTTFSAGVFDNIPSKIDVANNKILCLGNFTTYNSLVANNIVRLNLDGSIDNSFNSGAGFTISNIGFSLDFKINDNDNKIFISGSQTHYQNNPVEKIFRINEDGTFDSTFDFQPTFSNDLYGLIANIQHPVSLINLDDNQNLIATGNFFDFGSTNKTNGLIKVDYNGNRESSFSIGIGFGYMGAINKVIELNNGKILVGGFFDYVNDVERHGLVRLNNDGSIDDTFQGGFGFDGKSYITDFLIDTNDKIIVAGNFFNYDNNFSRSIIRLNSEGEYDSNFNTGTGFGINLNLSSVTDIDLQPDGKILAVGAFTSYNGNSAPKITRINTDGSYDNTISFGQGFYYSSLDATGGTPKTIKLQPTGKMLVVGDFTKYKNVVVPDFFRIDTNGNRDLTFDSTYLNYAFGNNFIFMNNDGSFLSKRVVDQVNRLTISNLDGGQINGVYPYHVYLFFRAFDSYLQNDNKRIVGGRALRNSFGKHLFRLNENQSLDMNFNIGDGFNSKYLNPKTGFIGESYSTGANGLEFMLAETQIRTIFSQNDGKLLVGGVFSHYGDNEATGLIRLINITSYDIAGENRLDALLDGCDSNDAYFPNLNFNIDGNQNNISNVTGNFNLNVSEGSHIITPILENPLYYNVSPQNISVNFPTQSSPFIQNFCVTPNGVHPDLEIVLLPITVARPGFDAKYKLVFKNKGNQLQSGSVSLVFDDNVLDLVSSVPAQSSLSGNILTWNYTNLLPMETREVSLTFNANTPTENPPLNGNDILSFTASILSPLTDEMPDDNTFILNQTVVNSYDPNDKTCLQGEMVSEESIDNFVHYVIHFENIGIYYAQNVIVTDYIDVNKFEISTLIPLKGSHLFTTKISDGNKVDFIFENINLPFDDANNDGYVAFKIKTKSSLVVGDTFSNSANIYFDYNSAITTNEFVTTIESTLSNPDYVFEEYFTVYPNPANDILNINKKDEVKLNSISIYNTLGQQVLVIPNAQNIKQIDITKLKTGAYFMLVNSDNGHSSVKFVKE